MIKKLGKSEFSLMRRYCSLLSDEDLGQIATMLPQTISGDREQACFILQKDKEIDRWLCHASGADDWFSRVDTIGEVAVEEIENRSKKLK
jgi:predicted GTPase